jgi:beta-galactosidase
LEGNAELIGKNPVNAEAGIATIIQKTTHFKKPLSIIATGANLQNGRIEIRPLQKTTK